MIIHKNDFLMKKSFIKVIKFKLNTKKLFIFSIFIIILYTLTNIHVRHESKKNSNNRVVLSKREQRRHQQQQPFVNKIDQDRLGRLFDILQSSEDKYGHNRILSEKLDLISFDRMKRIKNSEDTQSRLVKGDYGRFKYEIDNYLEVDSDNKLKPSGKFINYLQNKSLYFSYKHPRNEVSLNKIQSVSFRFRFYYDIFKLKSITLCVNILRIRNQ